MNGFFKNAALWVIIMIMVGLALFHLNPPASAKKELGPADFESQLQAGNIDNVAISKQGDLYTFRVALKTKIDAQQRFEFIYDVFPDEWRAKLNEQAIRFRIAPESTWLTALLINVLPLVLIFGVFWFFMFRQMQGGSNKALSFGKSRARLTSSTDKVVTFNDVAGVDEAKEELQEIIEFLKDPKKFSRLGGKIPKGVLLVGPPGTGKTLLARAVAGEAHAPFFSISGSDFVEMFVGVGASRVRDLFQQGQKHAPCIIFIDEIDAVGRQRGAGLGGGHDEREQTLNQLLVEMDGFSTSEGVILMAATNRPDVLDRALLRPGRFDRQVVVANPDITGREQILGIHIRNNGVPLAEDVTLRTLARGTPGFSGADLANMVNEAALLAARREQDKVSMQDFEDAKDRVLMGPERRSLALSVAERRNTAYHEAGHVLIGRLLKDADPVHKVTIIPRGPSLGATSMLPTEDRHSLSRAYLLASLRVLMGGRAAEEIIFNEFTSGAAGDLKVATDRAHAMVCEWGMSDLGPISFGTNAEVFLGRDFMKERQFSEETASSVDKAIHRFLEVAYADAKGLLTQHKDLLTAIAEELFERETLDADEIDDIIRRHGGADLIPPPPEPAPP
ncbi:MAG TPA: ATP-dependent zinc metalloprotease FtsH, partial [Candidatus Hydrogenedentes bacterium]|nr:ATP-dependent zinc metalloprotease FtsH [Candidatus Hydrogenedentota bacterium]